MAPGGRIANMKDLKITITGRCVKLEIIIFAGCLLFAQLVNIYSIVRFDSPWSEVVTSLHYILAVSVLTYLVIGLPRLILKLIKLLIKRLKQQPSE